MQKSNHFPLLWLKGKMRKTKFKSEANQYGDKLYLPTPAAGRSQIFRDKKDWPTNSVQNWLRVTQLHLAHIFIVVSLKSSCFKCFTGNWHRFLFSSLMHVQYSRHSGSMDVARWNEEEYIIIHIMVAVRYLKTLVSIDSLVQYKQHTWH